MRFRPAALATTIVAALALTACSSAATAPTSAPEGAITIEHALGTTVIPTQPQRVAAVNWANQDTALALGVVPVGFAAQTWGVTDGSGMLPWTKQKVEELGGSPVLFDETDGINFEAVDSTTPDVILAAYSGLTADDYSKLSGIAPTVAYPKGSGPWTTPWRDQIILNSEAMGMKEQGDALLADLEKQIADAASAHPELKDKTAAFFYGGSGTDLSKVGFYTTADPRAAYLQDLGLSVPPSVASASAGSTSFSVDISAENIDQLSDVDIIVLYGDQAMLDQWKADPLLGKIPAVANGSVAVIGSDGSLAASANPTPLSIPYSLDEYLGLISDAAAKVK